MRENCAMLGPVAVEDLDNAREELDFAITGGADAGAFSLAGAGVLAFRAPVDFEAPTDTDGDNRYVVELTVTDPDQGVDTKLFTIDVLDDTRDDAPVDGLIQGTNGNNLLRGTTGDDVFRPLGGPRDLLFLTQGGEDTIQFFGETSNGIAEIDFVIGFGGDDVLDLGGAAVEDVIQRFGRITLVLEGDQDQIVLTGVNNLNFDTQVINEADDLLG